MKLFDIFLKKSNSYNYYKNNYHKLVKENKLKEKKILKLEKELKESNKIFNSYENNFNRINKELSKIKNNTRVGIDLDREIKYALIFNDTIKNSSWVKSKNFSLNNAAANYSFMYVLFRILDETRPENILELGLGQTTKLTTQYANNFKNSKLLTVDGDQSWIDNFCDKLTIEGDINIVQNDLEVFNYNNTENLRYKSLKDVVGDEKFDLIIIDGPQGFLSPGFRELDYSRSNIWELIPDNLNEDFIIIMDDFERKGEKNTIGVVKKLLDENNINFHTFTSLGLKHQHVIASDKFEFVSWF